jgi:hypothetical protein
LSREKCPGSLRFPCPGQREGTPFFNQASENLKAKLKVKSQKLESSKLFTFNFFTFYFLKIRVSQKQQPRDRQFFFSESSAKVVVFFIPPNLIL